MISIIIPTLNEEKALEKTLKALKQFSGCPYEIIVSDGKSTDTTIAIAKKYADKVIEETTNERQTIAEGRNKGAQIAQGDYLVFLDADVEIPNINIFFKETLKQFENLQLVALSVFIKVFPDQSTFADRFFFSVVNLIYYISNNIFHAGAASGEFQMIRSTTFNEIGGFNKHLVAAEDNDLFARLAKKGRTKILSNLYVLHTSRRAHSVGWPRLLGTWFLNALYMKLFKKSFSSEWKVLR